MAEGGPQNTVEIGVGSSSFDVPRGTAMAGFIARSGPSAGTHDPLSAKALIFGQTLGIVAVDVCALHESTCEQIRDFGVQELGLQDVVVTATHTHGGPCVAHGRVGAHDAPVHDSMVRASCDALVEAHRQPIAATALWVEAHGLEVAHDRRRNEPLDIPLQTVRFYDAEGLVFAVLATFACHPVVLDGSNTLITADYPWAVRQEIEQRFPGAGVVFMTGAAGEINTGHSAMDSITNAGAAARSFARAAQIGKVLGQAAAGAGEPLQLGNPRFASQKVTIPYQTVPQAEGSGCESASESAVSWEGRVSALKVGELSLIFLPGEPFYAWAQPIAHSVQPTQPMGSPRAIVVGYSDGVPGYFPSPQAYAEGGYEVELAHKYYGAPGPFAEDCSMILSRAAHTAIRLTTRDDSSEAFE